MKITLEEIKRIGRGEIVSYSGDEALRAVRRDGYDLRLVKEQTPEMCLAAVKSDRDALKYVNEKIFETT